ncbi:hypothetical protein BDV95DRAFT_338432 [Massariosphaeria phaeospora]|uniref:Cx9C motif-containing protein 4, mitochondrial n=1 Tax=Massariosphaeria phaeospora TaxID=100035 RepID=A0A7C8MEH6_9PLEO|nr:hypothetical protein BDV95DRAFT_338432 [Massariosphaeria phaeospora]
MGRVEVEEWERASGGRASRKVEANWSRPGLSPAACSLPSKEDSLWSALSPVSYQPLTTAAWPARGTLHTAFVRDLACPRDIRNAHNCAQGPNEDTRTDPPCHSRACAIQNCLQKSNYQEEKCKKELNALYECCNAFYQEHGEGASTVCCPKPSLLKLKMKQRSQESS